MCLEKITQGPNPEEQGEGWKVFELYNGTLRNHCFLYDPVDDKVIKHEYLTDTWIADNRRYLIPIDVLTSYPTGFHVFLNKPDAEAYCNLYGGKIHKVKYRNVTAKGTQYVRQTLPGDIGDNPALHAPTVVAREIFIEKTPCPSSNENLDS
jgi:hypothetical protein